MKAVLFDVDFTLIYPGARFDAEGYEAFGRQHGLSVDRARFQDAVAAAAPELEVGTDPTYRPEMFVRYVRRLFEEMGGGGPGLDACAREVYDEWAACRHFSLYDDVRPVLEQLHARGLRLGLVSNTHRCLDTFRSHFELDPFIAAGVSSSDHGYMKPHPSIFEAALEALEVDAGDAVMVGDSLSHDVGGARTVGMHAVLLDRTGEATDTPPEVPVITTLRALADVV